MLLHTLQFCSFILLHVFSWIIPFKTQGTNWFSSIVVMPHKTLHYFLYHTHLACLLRRFKIYTIDETCGPSPPSRCNREQCTPSEEPSFYLYSSITPLLLTLSFVFFHSFSTSFYPSFLFILSLLSAVSIFLIILSS